MAANPGTEAHSTRAGLLQYVGTEPAPGEENAWDDGGGDAAGPIQIAGEAMARRLPFALCALPFCEELDVDYPGCEDSTHQQTHVFKTFVLALCNACESGQLARLRFVEHAYLDCARTHRVIDVDAPNPTQVRDEGCMCADLLRSMPTRNLINYIEEHGLCANQTDIVRAVLRRNTAMDAQLEPSKLWPGPQIFRRIDAVPDEAGAGRQVAVPLFSAAEHPSCYDCCLAVCCMMCWDLGAPPELDNPITLLWESGRPGPALLDAARSGRLEEFVGTEEVVAWVLGQAER